MSTWETQPHAPEGPHSPSRETLREQSDVIERIVSHDDPCSYSKVENEHDSVPELIAECRSKSLRHVPPLNKMAACCVTLGILLVRLCVQVHARGRKNALQMTHPRHFPHPQPKIPVHVGMESFVNRTNRLVQSTSKESGWLPQVVVKEQTVIG